MTHQRCGVGYGDFAEGIGWRTLASGICWQLVRLSIVSDAMFEWWGVSEQASPHKLRTAMRGPRRSHRRGLFTKPVVQVGEETHTGAMAPPFAAQRNVRFPKSHPGDLPAARPSVDDPMRKWLVHRSKSGGCRKALMPPDWASRPVYSMISSARTSTVGETSRPSALAVLRLSTVSYLVGACTGRSAGFSPLRMRST
jgi:hypothetical protein